MGTYKTKVNKYGLAELALHNFKIYQQILNDQDYINDFAHEFYAEVKYKGKMDIVFKNLLLRVENKLEKKIPFPENNKFVVVSIPDKQKPPEQKKKVKVFINIFFDGTKNSAKNTEARLKYQEEKRKGTKDKNLSTNAKSFVDNDSDESSYDNYYSNVALMYQLNIVEKEKREFKIYIEGEGTTDNESDDLSGYAFGSGDTGIPEKVNKGYKLIKEKIAEKKFLAKNEIVNEIEVNVFGFSRGSAAARHFIALKGKLQKYYNIESSKYIFKFVGLFETVSSYSANFSASPDFDHDQDELPMEIEDVQKVVHLTAENEHRQYFSLTTIDKCIKKGIGYHLQLPGVHSDLGGGYGEIENEVRDLSFERDYHNIETHLLQQGWYTKDQLYHKNVNMGGSRVAAIQNHLFGKRSIPLSYQFIPLAIMVHLAEKYGVKFDKSLIDTKGLQYNVPEDLQLARTEFLNFALQNDGAHSKKITVRQENLKPLRNKYLHRSACDSDGKHGRYKDGLPYRIIIPG